MMMGNIYHVISDKKSFTPSDYKELMTPHNLEERVVVSKSNIFFLS